MEKVLRHLVRSGVILAVSVLAGTLLLTLSFCLPTKPMIKNAASSLDYMIRSAEDMEEGSFERYLWGHKETYTDAIMVQNCLEEREDQNAFEQAMWANHTDLYPDFWAPEDSLRAFCSGDWGEGSYQHEYARYWHGYLIYLKPLLYLFSWKQLVIWGAVLQFAMMAAVVACSFRQKQAGVGIALIAGLLYTKPVVMTASLTMAVCDVITLGAMLIMLWRHEKLKEKDRYPEFFLLVGIVTAYFDFLTYPLVTLGFLLCALFLMEPENTLRNALRELVGYGFLWGCGYAGMWGMKWVVADVTLRTGTIKDALRSILGRTDVIGGRPRLNGGFYTISLNLKEYDSVLYAAGAILLVVLAVLTVLFAISRNQAKPVLKKTVLFAILFCIPFLWIIVVQHHSALHARFTFRILSIAAMALACISIEAITRALAQTKKS